jgi:hypothetical protein
VYKLLIQREGIQLRKWKTGMGGKCSSLEMGQDEYAALFFGRTV